MRALVLPVMGLMLIPLMTQSAEPSVSDQAMAPTTTPMKHTTYKADSDMQAVLATLAAMKGKPIETLEPAEARKQLTPTDAVMAVLRKQGKDTTPTALVPGVISADRTIPGPAGPLPVRTYTPAGNGPFPVVVYFHGGGWVIGDKNVYDGGARGLAKEANAVVVSVDYRLGPEAKFPAQHDDAVATYKWATQNASSIKGDSKRMRLPERARGATWHWPPPSRRATRI